LKRRSPYISIYIAVPLSLHRSGTGPQRTMNPGAQKKEEKRPPLRLAGVATPTVQTTAAIHIYLYLFSDLCSYFYIGRGLASREWFTPSSKQVETKPAAACGRRRHPWGWRAVRLCPPCLRWWGAAVPAAVCRWGLCPCGPGVGWCLPGLNNQVRVNPRKSGANSPQG